MRKPGWVRMNFSYLMSDETVEYIIDSVNELTRNAESLAVQYSVDETTARFKARAA